MGASSVYSRDVLEDCVFVLSFAVLLSLASVERSVFVSKEQQRLLDVGI